MNIRFSRRAVRDLTEIADYLNEQNPAAARRVRAAILDALRRLVLFPRIGRIQAGREVRKLVTRPYGYLVYYIVDETAAEIGVVTIRHPARRRLHHDV